MCGCTAAAWLGVCVCVRHARGANRWNPLLPLPGAWRGVVATHVFVHMGLHPAWCSIISWNLAVHGALAAAMLLRVLCVCYGRPYLRITGSRGQNTGLFGSLLFDGGAGVPC